MSTALVHGLAACEIIVKCSRKYTGKPGIAQLVEHLTVELCSYQMVPGSIPGGRILAELSHVLI